MDSQTKTVDFEEDTNFNKPSSFPKGKDRRATTRKSEENPITKHVQSVESYQWKGYGTTLGDVLKMQFVRKVKVCRSAQTDWNWRKMAERWGNARLIEPTPRVEYRQFYEEPKVDLDKIIGRPYSDGSSANESSGGSSSEADGAMEKERKKKKVKERDSLKPIISGAAIASAKEKKEKKKVDKEGFSMSTESEATKKKMAKKPVEKAPEHDVKYCRPFDKCVDTYDLEFDPFEPTLRYTRKETDVKPMYIPPEMKGKLTEFEEMWNRKPSFSEFNKMDSRPPLESSKESGKTSKKDKGSSKRGSRGGKGSDPKLPPVKKTSKGTKSTKTKGSENSKNDLLVDPSLNETPEAP